MAGNPTKAGAHWGFPSKDQHPANVSKLWPQYFIQTWKGYAALIVEKMMHSRCWYRQTRKGMVGSHSNCLAEFVCKFLATILSAKGTPKVRKKKVFFGPKTPFLDLFNPFWSLFVHFKPVCPPIFLRRKMSAKGGLLWRTKSAKQYWKASLKAFLLNSLRGAYTLH